MICQTNQTEIYYRIVYTYSFECIRLVLKNKGHVRLFQVLFGGRTGGEPAGGGARLVKRKYIIGLLIFVVSNAFD